MFGWISRRGTAPDYFSGQHDHTMKMIASHLDLADADSLAKVNTRSVMLFGDEQHAVDVHIGYLNKLYSPEAVQYILDAKARAVGDSMTLSEYLWRYRILQEKAEAGEQLSVDDMTPVLPRVRYETIKKFYGGDHADIKEYIKKLCLFYPDRMLSFDGKFFEEPISATFSSNKSEALLAVLVGAAEYYAPFDDPDPSPPSMRACKLFFEELGSKPEDMWHARYAVVTACKIAETVGERGEYWIPRAKRILDRVNDVMTPDINNAMSPADAHVMQAIYSSLHHMLPPAFN